ncbi:MAG: FHA domain-containing protein [Deltaproteobacteria bacterium]|nr:FHA domain-containing protein [Deltaproteobacteria bacterium]
MIGRSEHCALQISDRGVSKEHCEIRTVGPSWVIRDLGSKNGTFVNGRSVRRELWLRDNDKITVGGVTLSFRLSSPAAASDVVSIERDDADNRDIRSVVRDAGTFLPAAAIPDIEALRKDYERLRLAFEVYRDLSAHTEQESLLEKALDRIFQVLPAQSAAIMLNAEDGTPVPVATRARGEAERKRIVVSSTILQKAIKNGEAVLTGDALRDSRFAGAESLVARGVRSAMCVPICGRGGVLGAIHLEAPATAAFTEKDLAVLASMAAQAGVAVEHARLSRTMAEEMLTRERLSRYLSPVLVDRVVSRQTELSLEGSLRRATVMFADIRQFTRLTARASPHEIVELLNAVFGVAADAVFVHNGVLDKFIGDAVMAVWGAAEERPDDAALAVRAAVEVQRGISVYSEAEVRAGRRAVALGIGLATGDVVVGDMGSGRRMDFTAIGASVNLASRLCSRAAGGEILASEATAEALGNTPEFPLRDLGPVPVKGHDEPVRVFSVTYEP